MSNKLRQFQSLLNEGISQEDLCDSLMNRLQMRYPDLLDKYGYDAVEDAVNDVASFHAGAEELGSSDISIMLKEIIKALESSAVDESSFYNPRRRYVDPDGPEPVRIEMPRHVPSQDEIEAEKEYKARKRAELDRTMKWMFPDKKGVSEASEWETRHDEFTTVGDRATPEQINKIVSALSVAAKQAISKRGFLNQIVGKQSNGDLARMAHGAETLAKNIQRNSNAKSGTDERKELGQHLVYAVSLLKRMNGQQGVAEDSDPCWDNYKQIGMKMKNGKKVPNCVPKESVEENAEYDDEAGSAESNLLTLARAVKGLLDTIEDRDNLPEWVQEKIAKAEGMLVTAWDYLQSQKAQGIDPQIDEDWQKANKSDKTDGMSRKAVKAYRRENPGSKLQTAVTKKPSELKPGSKEAKRRKSFCARMSGNKGPMKDEKGRPTPKAKALARWNCNENESVEEGLGTPYPGTYEQENNMFKTKGPRQTPKIAFEEQEKIAGRYDPDEFDAMVKRVGQRAKEGPLKTVWDPVKKVFKNVPVKQEPVKESSILKGLKNAK